MGDAVVLDQSTSHIDILGGDESLQDRNNIVNLLPA